jgi:diaminopropionate ammonia-lyase
LRQLPALAAELGVAKVHVKDEGGRLRMGSFKALGGGYATALLVLEQASVLLGRSVGFDDLDTAEVRWIAGGMMFACATDGNHGRSVARGARRVGAKATIIVHERVSESRVAALHEEGAAVVCVPGTYDDAVVEAARLCAEHGWHLVSDTSWPGYERVPRLVMQGYTAIAREIEAALADPPTHVFLQAGVGGFAAAMAGYFACGYGDDAPVVVVVEPRRAACLFESLRAGKSLKIPEQAPTVMAMLECYEPSSVAWRMLARLATGFMTVDEHDAVMAMQRLAQPIGSDPAIVSGESGGVGLAGLMQVCGEAHARRALGLGPESRVLVINTEGVSDPLLYARLMQATPPAAQHHAEEALDAH